MNEFNNLTTTFNLWSWLQTHPLLCSIQQIKIIKNKPKIRGYVTFGSLWYPINPTLKDCLNHNIKRNFNYSDIKLLATYSHPISTWANKIINQQFKHHKQDLKHLSSLYNLNDELQNILKNPDHKLYSEISIYVTNSENTYLNPPRYHLTSIQFKDLIKYLIDDIQISCLDPHFKLNQIPIIYGENKQNYGFFQKGDNIFLRKITADDYVEQKNNSIIIPSDRFENYQQDLNQFERLMRSWLFSTNERNLFRSLLRKIILGESWDKKLTILKLDDKINGYDPSQYLLWIHSYFHGITNNYIIDQIDDLPRNKNEKSLYIFSGNFIKSIKKGYVVQLTHQQPQIQYCYDILVHHIGRDYFSQESWFEDSNKYLLSGILWAFEDNLTISI